MADPPPVSRLDWLKRIDAAQHHGELLAAAELAGRALEEHSEDVDFKYRQVLSLARAGAADLAKITFDRLGLRQHQTEDILALEARLAKDKALLQGAAARRKAAAEAARLYHGVYRKTHGTYTGINAATLFLIAGDRDLSRSIAGQIVKDASSAGDYYGQVTLAEALLLLGDTDGARRRLKAASGLRHPDRTAIAGTRRQLRLICDILRIDPSLVDVLEVPRVIHFTGHMAFGRHALADCSDADMAKLASDVDARLAHIDAGYGFGSLASGADILFAEALLRRGAELNVVLPFAEEEFIGISVRPAGEPWVERFNACRERAASVAFATKDAYLGDDSLFGYAAQLAMGMAINRARLIDARLEQIAIWDERGGQGAAGTASDVATWRARGMTSTVIRCPSRPPRRNRRKVRRTAKRVSQRQIVAILFGDVKGFSGLREAQLPGFVNGVLAPFAKAIARRKRSLLFKNTWGDGLFLVFDDPAQAALCALDLQDAMSAVDFPAHMLPANMMLRIGGHVGPAFRIRDPILERPNFEGSHVTRAARIEPITPPGGVFVTEPFAAALSLAGIDVVASSYAGLVPMAKGYGIERMYLLRRAGR